VTLCHNGAVANFLEATTMHSVENIFQHHFHFSYILSWYLNPEKERTQFYLHCIHEFYQK